MKEAASILSYLSIHINTETVKTDKAMYMLCDCAMVFIRPIACVGSGDPVRVLRLYTTITLDEVCSIYC